MTRSAEIVRQTKETTVTVSLNLDGQGVYSIHTPIGFLNHMLELLSKHSQIDFTIQAQGDMHIGDHHTVEDIGLILGETLNKALGEKKGIRRYGSMILPMDEVLMATALDLSGRFYFESNYAPERDRIGDLSSDMVNHFFRSFAEQGRLNLHFHILRPGVNEHHCVEAMFKSLALCLRQAVALDPGTQHSIPSTKGKL